MNQKRSKEFERLREILGSRLPKDILDRKEFEELLELAGKSAIKAGAWRHRVEQYDIRVKEALKAADSCQFLSALKWLERAIIYNETIGDDIREKFKAGNADLNAIEEDSYIRGAANRVFLVQMAHALEQCSKQ